MGKTKVDYQRAPIVTIMGHVDHGKTTLLDSLRESHIVQTEHGGITQHIGAYQVTYENKPITFIDTPGHAAFSKMRARGASVTDVIVLVVAADDGVKPQTVESIKHIKAAKVPLVIAINKMDVEGASPEMVKAQLTEHEIFCEGFGGQIPAVEISAIKKQGLDNLLEIIQLVADLEELSTDPDGELDAIIIESHVERGGGPMATAIVKRGTIAVGDEIYTGTDFHKVRALFNHLGKKVKSAGPGEPIRILGLRSVPNVGTIVTDKKVETDVLESAPKTKITQFVDNDSDEEEQPKLKLIVKADTAGTLEAILQSITQDEVVIVDKGIGSITESDVLNSQTTNALLIGFNVKIVTVAKKLAKIEGVKIQLFNIIYKLIEFIEKKLLKVLEPSIDEKELGLAKILQTFNIKGEKIAGCKVISGEMSKGTSIHVLRNEEIIKSTQIKSLRRGKEIIEKAKKDSECGIILKKDVDFKEGDMIRSYIIIDDDED